MKKLMRKLVLSCFALGLAVVTLSTTTFAWYTTNTEATITGVQGTTQGEVAGSLEIAKLSAPNTWKPTVELNKAAADVATDYISEGNEMIPLQLQGGSLYGIDPQEGKQTESYKGAAASAGQYIQFSIYVRNSTGEATSVYLKSLVITNTVANDALPMKNQLVANGTGGMTGQLGDSYQVDAVKALSMTFTSSTAAIGGSSPVVSGSNATRYSVSEAQTTLPGSGVSADATHNALEYYNAVMNPNGTGHNVELPTYEETALYTKTNGGINAIKVADILAWENGAPSYTTLTFTIWLEGWDNYCYDACQGQSFNISFALTSVETDALIGTKA